MVFEIFHKRTATPELLPLLQSRCKHICIECPRNTSSSTKAVGWRDFWDTTEYANLRQSEELLSERLYPDVGDRIISETLVYLNHLTQLSAQGDSEGAVRGAHILQKPRKCWNLDATLLTWKILVRGTEGTHNV